MRHAPGALRPRAPGDRGPILTTEGVEQPDVDVIVRSLGSWQCTERWALGGQTPSPAFWGQLFYQDVALQGAVRLAGGTCIGLLQLARVNADDGFGHLDLLLDPGHAEAVDAAVADFVERAFATFPLRKLLMEAAEDDIVLPPCLARAVRATGRLRDHRRRSRDSYASVNLYELWADDWPSTREP